MSHRHFALPMTALGLTLSTVAATGCGSNGLMGEWLLTRVVLDGEDLSSYFLDGSSYTYDGCTYTTALQVSMEFDEKDGKELSGKFVQGYSYTYDGESCTDESRTDAETYDAEAEETDKNAYDIDVDDLDLDLSCTLDEDALRAEIREAGERYLHDCVPAMEAGAKRLSPALEAMYRRAQNTPLPL